MTAFMNTLTPGTVNLRAFSGARQVFKGGAAMKQGGKMPPTAFDMSETLTPAEQERGVAFLHAVLKNAHGICGLQPGAELYELFEFARAVGRDPTVLERTEITTIYGGSDAPELSLRLPAYILPAIGLTRDLRAAGLPTPRIRVVVARQAAAGVNGFSHEGLMQNASRTIAVLRNFVHAFALDVTQLIAFEEDVVMSGDGEELARTLQQMMLAEVACEPGGDLAQVLSQLARHAEDKVTDSPLQAAALYGALHPLYSGDAMNGFAWSERLGQLQEGVENRSFISIGGASERFFNFLRCWVEIATRGMSQYQFRFPARSMKLLTEVGRVPVYYPTQDEPVLTLESLTRVHWPDLISNPLLKRDYEEIGRIVDPGDYLAWARRIAGA